MKRTDAGAILFALSALVLAPIAVRAQIVEPGALPSSFEPSKEEADTWALVAQKRWVGAREKAEALVARDPASFVGQMALGWVYHYAESNLPRALYHLERARTLLEGRLGKTPTPDRPWRWHAVLLEELASTHGDMEHHAEKLAFIGRFNELYEPDMLADRAWPLMKLGRYTEAKLAADLALRSGDPDQRTIAFNALCAIEFEAGNDGASYDACKAAVDDSTLRMGRPSVVDLTNLAEAARSLFKLAEAERLALEATDENAPPSWYGNPWMELAELFVREGRFSEALGALERVPAYRQKRPAHVRHADRNEMRRAIASLLLVLGRTEDAFALTERALAAPERRAHNSRDPEQDRIVLALVDRRARLVTAERIRERAASEVWYRRPLGWLEAAWHGFAAWRSAAIVEQLLSGEDRLVGSFRIGTAHSAVIPPWLVGDLIGLVGPGVAEEALHRARAHDRRESARGYHEAVAAEVVWAQGRYPEALAHAERALAGVGQAEVLVRARAHAIAADSAERAGGGTRAAPHYDTAFQTDPGVFRRLGMSVAVTFRATGGAVAREAAEILARSPRFRVAESGLGVSVEADATGGHACLGSGEGQVIVCSADIRARTTEAAPDLAARIARQFLQEAFAPRVDMTQADVNSLDGTNIMTRDALQTLFE